MKQENTCSLFQEGFTTIAVKFNERSRNYIYKALLEDDIEVGDHVIVNNKIGDDFFSTAEVVEVHSEPQIDYGSNIVYKWIIQKVDVARYQKILESEKEFNKILAEIEKKSIKNKISDHFKENLPEDQKSLFDNALETLQLSHKTCEAKQKTEE